MSASIDEYLQEAANTLYALNADEAVRKRCRDRLEYYQDLKNYERKIERDRLEHEQDLKNYERKIERDRLAHEQDKRNYEQKIEQNRLAHEQTLAARDRTIAAQEEQIRLLIAENERLKQKK